MRTRIIFLLLFGLALGGLAFAQTGTSDYPSKAITIVVPFPPGGSADGVPRIIADKLRERWGQPVLIENRPGAAGSTGSATVARAAPDGYTLLSSPAGPLVINQFVQKNFPFDPAALVPVALLASVPSVMSVRPNLPFKTVRELIDYAKANPGKLNYASQGPGSTSHLTGVMFQNMTGTEMVHIPYRGTGPALTGLMAADVDLFFDNLGSSISLHRAGKLKIMAVATAERVAAVPDVPTLQEAGVADFESSTWFAIMAPPGTPDAIADQLSQAIGNVLALPDVSGRLIALGLQPEGGSRKKLATKTETERRRWDGVVKAANVPAE
jgi:tripartite-type tricarboxylate transporter receptor subunit TctC